MNLTSLYLCALVFIMAGQTDAPVSAIDKFDKYGLLGLIVFNILLQVVPMLRKVVETKITSKSRLDELEAQQELDDEKEARLVKRGIDERQIKVLENLTLTLGDLNVNMTKTCERMTAIQNDTQFIRNGTTEIKTILSTSQEVKKKPTKSNSML